MATSQSISNVVDIIHRQNADVAVVSAPGKRFTGDDKTTDLLFDCYDAFLKSGRCDVPFAKVENRIVELAEGVGVTGIKPYLDQIRHDINAGAGFGYTVSRGEFLSALLMRHLLSCEFIDAKEVIKFDIAGKIDLELSYQMIAERLRGCGRAVVPGYYGAMPGGEIKTFTRGGSDVSGAVVAAGAGAVEYQNWTDVDGVYFCPLTDICSVVPALSYQEMRQIAFLGGSVLHPDSLPPLMERGVEVRVKNTFNPAAAGTLITGAEKAEFLRLEAAGGENKENKTKTRAESLPVAVSGLSGFKLLSFYSAGSCGGDYAKKLFDLCKQRGAKVFTVASGVDRYEVVLSGETGRLTDCEGEQDIAVITVVRGDKNYIIRRICEWSKEFLFLQWAGEGGIILGVKKEEINNWLRFFCDMKYSNPVREP